MTERDVIVVGAGIAGLVAARDLALAGLSVTILEASDSPGGKVCSQRVAGLTLDAGAESFATRGGTVERLVRELGMADLLVAPQQHGAWLRLLDGRTLPLPNASLLGIPGTPMAADVLEIVGFGGALRAQLDSLIPWVVGSKERTIGALVRRRMGARVLERLVAPVVAGVHSRHPDEIEIDLAAPGLRRALKTRDSLAGAVLALRDAAPPGAKVMGLRGGVHTLVSELAADLHSAGVDIRVGNRASRADSDGVTTESGERLHAAVAVLSSTPEQPAGGARISLATLVVDSSELDDAPRGTGLLVTPGAEGVAAKAITHATAKWQWLAEVAGPHRHVLRLSYGGDATDLPDDELFASARADAESLLGVPLPQSSILDAARENWTAPSQGGRYPTGVLPIGEGTAGTGLAAVIEQARNVAATVLSQRSE
jgi:oxygen-dependent protoporphyrinogen oxidase